MIFQSLISLYERLEKTGDVPPYGFSIEDIGFVVTIDKAGNMIGQPEDLRGVPQELVELTAGVDRPRGQRRCRFATLSQQAALPVLAATPTGTRLVATCRLWPDLITLPAGARGATAADEPHRSGSRSAVAKRSLRHGISHRFFLVVCLRHKASS